jgi:hypothetical protein
MIENSNLKNKKVYSYTLLGGGELFLELGEEGGGREAREARFAMFQMPSMH